MQTAAGGECFALVLDGGIAVIVWPVQQSRRAYRQFCYPSDLRQASAEEMLAQGRYVSSLRSIVFDRRCDPHGRTAHQTECHRAFENVLEYQLGRERLEPFVSGALRRRR